MPDDRIKIDERLFRTIIGSPHSPPEPRLRGLWNRGSKIGGRVYFGRQTTGRGGAGDHLHDVIDPTQAAIAMAIGTVAVR
jgi:hypothetical protein